MGDDPRTMTREALAARIRELELCVQAATAAQPGGGVNMPDAQLLQQQKMAALGQLAAGVAHDFNNLLAIIMGHSDLLHRRFVDDEAVRASTGEITKAAEHAAKLVRRLLLFGRPEAAGPAVLDLNVWLDDTSDMLQVLAGERVRLTVAPDEAPATVRIDAGHLEQMIMNLVANARDAMPDGGAVTIRVQRIEVENEPVECERVALPPGRYVHLTVTDDGIGMDEATRQRALDPFFSTKGQQGAGLGLATVATLAGEYGGGVSLMSTPGHGAAIGICLPLIQDRAVSADPAAAVPPPSATGETVLIVEDRGMVRDFMAKALELHGFTVMAAADAREALELAADMECSIDLLLTDVVLPRLDGFELAERLLANRPDLKVLYVSAYYDEETVRSIEKTAAFLPKPCKVDQLVAKVRDVLDG